MSAVIIVGGFGIYFSSTLNTNDLTTTSSSAGPDTTSVSTVSAEYQLVDTKGEVFLFNDIPYQFVLGNFTVDLVNNGTGYDTPQSNGTSTMFTGFVFAFNVTALTKR